MKTSNLLALLFLVVISISANAQNEYLLDNYEFHTKYDTLPDGTVINLLEGTFVEITSTQTVLKSVKQNANTEKRPLSKYVGNNTVPKQLKSAQLIKSLNQQTSSYYMEKLDSIVEYEAILSPGYDSAIVENTKQKFNENGYLIESIVQVYDSITNTLINYVKYEYTPDAEGRLLKQFNYDWTGDIWGISNKNEREYNSAGLITRSAFYDWNGSGWANSFRYEYEYDSNGNIISYSSYRVDENGEWIGNYKYIDTFYENGEHATNNYFAAWNTLDSMWTREGKTEYNEQGQRTVYYYKNYNAESKEWEYYYKYEYNYLGDESIVETRYAWNAETKELYQQYQNRYKIEVQYENERLTQEIRLNFVNENWEYTWKKVYEYDQLGNEILYEVYDPYWGDYGELKERRIRSFTETGQLTKYENYRWEIDEDYGYYKKIGVQFYEYKRNVDDKILSYTSYKWDEENEEWLVDWKGLYSYPTERERTLKRYQYNVNGYYADYVKDYKTVIDYDASIGRYSTIREDGDEDVMKIFYNDANKVKEIIYYYNGEIDFHIECYYDALGRDSLWISSYSENNGNEGNYIDYVQFSYKNISDNEIEVTEFYYNNQPDTIFSEYGEILNINTDDLIKYILKGDNIQKIIEYDFVDGEWIASDSTYFNYNSLGQIISYGDETGNYQWKYEYDYNNDTLTVKEYSRYPYSSNSEWEVDNIEIYVTDPTFSKAQFQKIPAAILDDRTYWYEWHFMFDYGKPLENISYRKNYNDNGQEVNDDFEISYKSILYYSQASALQGESIISGFIFDDSGVTKSIEITKSINGNPVEGAIVSLCASEDNYVLATRITGVDGFYEFKGVPQGNFYIKVEMTGYEQTSKHEINVTKDAGIFENKNYRVMNGELVVRINELKSKIQIFPNPAKGYVFIYAQDNIVGLKIIDLNGRTRLFDSETFSKNMKISIETLPDGLYIFEIETNQKIFREKVMVKK